MVRQAFNLLNSVPGVREAAHQALSGEAREGQMNMHDLYAGRGQIPDWIYFDSGAPESYFVGRGWVPMLEVLHDCLSVTAPEYRVGQIKEKFGGLRCYIDTYGEGIEEQDRQRASAMVDMCEALSYRVCEECGREGRTRYQRADHSWAWNKTLCDEHATEDGYFIDGGVYVTGTWQRLAGIHRPEDCEGRHCVIHNPSEHRLSGAPTHWRSDRGIMERICEHGVGHPDPDDLVYRRSVRFREMVDAAGGKPLTKSDCAEELGALGIHGCDGCCTKDEAP